MKIFISIFIICFGTFVSDPFSFITPEGKDHHGGRCTGSAYCTACSSCSRCGHCSGGGTCGVCKGSFSGTKASSKRSSSKKSGSKELSESGYLKSDTKRNSKIPRASIDDLAVTIPANNIVLSNRTVTVFEKPSFQSRTIEIIPKNTPMISILKNGSWYKVKVQKSGKTGYITSNDISNLNTK
ncbi:hypothetical protein [Chryseobacterium sp.]|uniref:hypothetical protein n=1 Tax=Chryseobacterium sp. TaxID=1871047 RepID=UPI0025BAB84F|nr:hypothetical protein [Chryseobacterium sp.]MBV8327186.1 SH3 domain-containing protein [Chryseobacterium sp.]